MVEVGEGGHLFFASHVEPCRQSRGGSDFLGGGRPWVVILSLIIMYCFFSLEHSLSSSFQWQQLTMINKVASLFGLVVLSALSVTDHGVMGRELIAERLGQQSAQTRNVSQWLNHFMNDFKTKMQICKHLTNPVNP
jgi:hypothetical protein